MPSTSLDDIKTLLRSMHAVVASETVEEERLDALLAAAAAALDLPLFTWSLTTGLARHGATTPAVHGTADPLVLLKHLRTLTVRAVFHLKDFGPHLSAPAVVRASREVAQAFDATRSTVVLSGATVPLPPELADRAVPFRLELPTRGELDAMLQQVTRALRQTHRVRVTLDAGARARLVETLAGLTINQARFVQDVGSDLDLRGEDRDLTPAPPPQPPRPHGPENEKSPPPAVPETGSRMTERTR